MDKATEEWLNSQKHSSRYIYKSVWKYFTEFTGLTGDQILESRKADKEYAWEKRVMEFRNWIIEEKKKSENTAKTAAMAVRGFFSYYRMDIKLRRSESAKISEAKPKFEDYRFSREDLKKMSDVADLQEKYVIVAGKSFGLRAGDFLRLTRGDLEPYLDRPVPISLGEYATQKERVKAFPFIDSDALPVIKLMIEKMDREGRTNPTDRILIFSAPVQLTRVIKRIVEKAGIKTGNKRVRFHCLRKFLTDRLSSYMSESKWKQIVGKKISEQAYVSPDSLRQDYIRAMNETCFSKMPTEGDVEALAKKQALIILAKNAGYTDKEIRETFRERASNMLEEIDVLEDLIEKKRRTAQNGGSAANDCPDGQNCFKEIAESELLSYLERGWKIVHNLQNGRLIVERR